MRSNLVKKVAAFAVCAMLLCTVAFAAEVPSAPPNGFVKDLANVIDPSTEQQINDIVQLLVDDNGAEIMVLTTDFSGGDLQNFAYDVFDEWKPGDKKKDNGALLVMTIGEQNYYCVMGSGLEDNMPASTLSDILDENLKPDFLSGEYAAGVLKFVKAMDAEVGSIYGYDDSSSGSGINMADRVKRMSSIVMITLAIIVAIVILSSFGGARRRRRYYNSYSGPSSYYHSGYHRTSYSRPSRSSWSSRSSSSHSSSRSSSSSHRSSSGRRSYHRSGGGSTRGGGAGLRR